MQDPEQRIGDQTQNGNCSTAITGKMGWIQLHLQKGRQKLGFPGDSDGKESACNAGDPGSVPRLGKSPGERNGNPLQYYCLENSMDRGAGGLQSMRSQRVRQD